MILLIESTKNKNNINFVIDKIFIFFENVSLHCECYELVNFLRESDDFDEGEEGSAIIDNEVGFVHELICGKNMSIKGDTVQECINFLTMKFDGEQMEQILFACKNGGTENENYWEIVNRRRQGLISNNSVYNPVNNQFTNL